MDVDKNVKILSPEEYPQEDYFGTNGNQHTEAMDIQQGSEPLEKESNAVCASNPFAYPKFGQPSSFNPYSSNNRNARKGVNSEHTKFQIGESISIKRNH